jgi:MoxR-like ATPase
LKEKDMASADGVEKLEDAIVRSAEQVSGQIRAAKEAISTVIFGQDRVIEVRYENLQGGRFRHASRMVRWRDDKTPEQCTYEQLDVPVRYDLAEVLETGADGTRAFRFIDGPIFCQLLMADEINRASPRTQSALLQAMQEKEVSVAGQRRILPKPFHVLATQNPIEQEGTYPLPEAGRPLHAQADRRVSQQGAGA